MENIQRALGDELNTAQCTQVIDESFINLGLTALSTLRMISYSRDAITITHVEGRPHHDPDQNETLRDETDSCPRIITTIIIIIKS